MELQVVALAGKQASKVQVPEQVFGCEFKEALIHQVITAQLAGARAGTKAQKNRSAVSGGGAKPWRQKGTGRARAGTSRSPIWRTGGKTFAATPRDFSQKVNKKMYRRAIASILSELIRQERLTVVDDLLLTAAKTKELITKLEGLKATGQIFILVAGFEENLMLAARNLPYVGVSDVMHLDPVALVGADRVVITLAALKQLEEKFA